MDRLVLARCSPRPDMIASAGRSRAPFIPPAANDTMMCFLCSQLPPSIRLDVVFARDRPPQSHLLADELPKLFRAAQRERHLLGLIELFGDARVAQGRRQLVGEPADDRLRRACWCKDAPPGISLEPGIALNH